MNIGDLKRKARRGTLEVEHLLQAAVARVPNLATELNQLTVEHEWKTAEEVESTREVPFATWAAVAGAYADGGLEGLHALRESSATFCIALLEEIGSKEAVEALLAWWPDLETSERAWRIASALNLILSFKGAPNIAEDQRCSVRQLSYRLYPVARTEVERATALLLLRGVGDEQSLTFVSQAQEFEGAWAETKRAVTTAIRRRLRSGTRAPTASGATDNSACS